MVITENGLNLFKNNEKITFKNEITGVDWNLFLNNDSLYGVCDLLGIVTHVKIIQNWHILDLS